MEVARISNINLAQRTFLTKVYGPGTRDNFVGPDLRWYGINQMLYHTFRSQGYHVVFFSESEYYRYYSYREADLAEFFNNSRQSAQPVRKKYVAQIDSPNGKRRRARAEAAPVPAAAGLPQEEGNYSSIYPIDSGRNTKYRVNNTMSTIHTIAKYVRNHPDKKIVFVFPTEESFDGPEMNKLIQDSRSHHYQARLVVVMQSEPSDEEIQKKEEFYKQYCYIGSPQRDEYLNLLNRRRLLDPNPALLPQIERLAVRFSQRDTNPKAGEYQGELDMLDYYLFMPTDQFDALAKELDSAPAEEQLNALVGIEPVRQQLEAYLERLKDPALRKRPHLVFTGNPGTGKTTVARLLAEIMRERGLLKQGHLVQATVGDMVAQHVGGTRPKTQALCDRSRGGVLFIDEAYGLMSGRGGNGADFGQEAIEVLLQFMENDPDALVIMAGYKEEMDDLIQNGNAGLQSRIPPDNFIHFPDYEPDALFTMFRRKVEKQGLSLGEGFEQDMRGVITFMYTHRNARWANARDMDNLANSVISRHQGGPDVPLTREDIPEDKLRYIRTDFDVEGILRDINALVGLPNVKRELTTLLESTIGQRLIEQSEGTFSDQKPNLNYLFLGPPGTGKSTVARLMARIFYETGLIEKNETKDLQKGEIIQSGVGDTPKVIAQIFKDHSGKVILIDEAYGLKEHREAINEIVNNINKPQFAGNQVVIMAGYEEEMDEMLALNPGFADRFQHRIVFDPFTNDDLWQVLEQCARQGGMTFDAVEDCRKLADDYFNKMRTTEPKKFSNARAANNLYATLRNAYTVSVYHGGAKDNLLRPDHFPNRERLTVQTGAKEKLEAMIGTREICEQIDSYVEDLRDSEVRTRPHLAFVGNPGTGKTTVARLLAERLKEEGVLKSGHLVQVTVGDLVAQHVGCTRPKTEEVCAKARGGILFIDEAYGLMSGRSDHGDGVDYGKEAIEVLLQFMENDHDSVVIFAGYEAEMDDLIKNGNAGLQSRFYGKLRFKDYTAEELVQIFHLNKTRGRYTSTHEFDDAMARIITFMHSHRSSRWGNARTMENLFNSVVSCHRGRGREVPLDMQDIPADRMRYIRSDFSVEDIMRDIDALVGLAGVKQKLKDLLGFAIGLRISEQNSGRISAEKPNLNFLFTGNPGTGKTTVARLMARILYEAGLIEESVTFEAQKGDIVASVVGGTPKKVQQLFRDHGGQVIFVDEAYGLMEHGSEAIDEITKALTQSNVQGNQAFIMAGYDHQIAQMVERNSGLLSRFPNLWHFDDYSNDDLWQVLLKKAASVQLAFSDEAACRDEAARYFDQLRRERREQFANVREADTLFSTLRTRYYSGLSAGSPDDHLLRPEFFPLYGIIEEQAPARVEISLADDEERRVSAVDHYDDAVGLVSGRAGEGTAFVISTRERLALTCSHVVENDSGFTVGFHRGQVRVPAQVIWNNPMVDMALLRLDSLPATARSFRLDRQLDQSPQKLSKLEHCGFLLGTEVSDNFFASEGVVSGYDPRKPIAANRCFDAILSNLEAKEGCSGGPVVRPEDKVVVGLLQGGFANAPARVITDIHQLFKQDTLIIQ